MNLTCIALRTTRYSDRYDILSAYSREIGRVALLVPAGSGKEARRVRALVQPLSLFSCTSDIRPTREIHSMSQCSLVGSTSAAIGANPLKTSVAIFLAEILSTLLRENQADEATFEFLKDAVERLATTAAVANFHICFLYHFAQYVGIAPDTATYSDRRLFDLQNARFLDTPPLHNDFLGPDESAVFHSISRMTFDNMRFFEFNRQQRAQILSLIMRYYTIHYASLSSVKSLTVLQSLFD
ncbi:MAG: DNA repair protein RecO [Muribaculaceae bacterium]|nr:DNA repair protein RecO [Muribaculaceae bacterium]